MNGQVLGSVLLAAGPVATPAGARRAFAAAAANEYVSVSASGAIAVLASGKDFQVVVASGEPTVAVSAQSNWTLTRPTDPVTLTAAAPATSYAVLRTATGEGTRGGSITRTVLEVDLVLRNMSATVADGGSIADMDETQEEADGAEIRINADFDETNKNAANKPLEDFRPDNTAGHRITANDPDLLDGTLRIEGGNAQGKWKLVFPDKVRVWKQDGANWTEVTSGTESSTITLPLNLPLKVEGIDGSTATEDIEVKAEFTPTGATAPCTDKALITSVKTEFMLTFDDGPYESETMEVVNAAANVFVNGTPVRLAFFMVGTDGSGAYVGDPVSKGSVLNHSSVSVSVDQANHGVYNHADTHLHAWKGAFCLAPRTVEEMQADIQACKTRLADALSRTPDAYFRAPYWGKRYAMGEYNTNLTTACENLGLTIIWGKSGFGEVEYSSWSTVAENTRSYLATWCTKADPARRQKPAVICYHEYRDAISDRIADIADSIRNKGFLLVSFDPDRCEPSRTYYDY